MSPARIARRGAVAGRGAAAPPATVTVLTLPGTAGNYVSTPDSAANSITSDIDMRAKVARANWTAATTETITAKFSTAGLRSWRWDFRSSGTMRLLLYPDGSTTSVGATSTASLSYTAGTAHWVRVTWRNSDDRTQFLMSDDGTSWTQLGADVTMSATGIFNSSSPVEIGGGPEVSPSTATIYYVDIRSSIDGSPVAKFDPSAVVILGTRNPTTVIASTGETWTVNGSAWDWATV